MIKNFPNVKYSFYDEYNRTSLFVKGNQLPVYNHSIYNGFINMHQNINTKAAGLYNIETALLELWNNAITYLRCTLANLKKEDSMIVIVSPL